MILGRLTCFLESGLPEICEVLASWDLRGVSVAVGDGSWILVRRRQATLLVPGVWFLSSVVVAEGDDRDRDLMVRDKKRGAEAPLTVSLASRT